MTSYPPQRTETSIYLNNLMTNKTNMETLIILPKIIVRGAFNGFSPGRPFSRTENHPAKGCRFEETLLLHADMGLRQALFDNTCTAGHTHSPSLLLTPHTSGSAASGAVCSS